MFGDKSTKTKIKWRYGIIVGIVTIFFGISIRKSLCETSAARIFTELSRQMIWTKSLMPLICRR